jgi:hypothetical protein
LTGLTEEVSDCERNDSAAKGRDHAFVTEGAAGFKRGTRGELPALDGMGGATDGACAEDVLSAGILGTTVADVDTDRASIARRLLLSVVDDIDF